MNLHEMADEMAERYGLDPAIFRKQIETESGFQESSVSPVGARGLGQVMPATARDPGYGVTPLPADLIDDPEENLRFAAEYMRAMLDKYDGDYSLALSAYNAGAGAVDKAGGVPNFEETQNYVSKILGSSGEGLGSLPEAGRPETEGGVEAALRLLLESDGGEEAAGRDRTKAVMTGLSALGQAFDRPKVSPVKSSATVQRGSGGDALSRFEGLASLRSR